MFVMGVLSAWAMCMTTGITEPAAAMFVMGRPLVLFYQNAAAIFVNFGNVYDYWCKSTAEAMFVIQSLSKTCRLNLRNIYKLRPFLTNQTTKLLIHSLVISRLDYCNSLLIGLPLHILFPFQSIMNAAARLIHLTN